MIAEIEFSERRLEKAGFSYEAAVNTVKTAFKQRGVRLVEEDISLIFEGSDLAVSKAVEGLKKKSWFNAGCVLCDVRNIK